MMKHSKQDSLVLIQGCHNSEARGLSHMLSSRVSKQDFEHDLGFAHQMEDLARWEE